MNELNQWFWKWAALSMEALLGNVVVVAVGWGGLFTGDFEMEQRSQWKVFEASLE
jgi:hypothetical protein